MKNQQVSKKVLSIALSAIMSISATSLLSANAMWGNVPTAPLSPVTVFCQKLSKPEFQKKLNRKYGAAFKSSAMQRFLKLDYNSLTRDNLLTITRALAEKFMRYYLMVDVYEHKEVIKVYSRLEFAGSDNAKAFFREFDVIRDNAYEALCTVHSAAPSVIQHNFINYYFYKAKSLAENEMYNYPNCDVETAVKNGAKLFSWMLSNGIKDHNLNRDELLNLAIAFRDQTKVLEKILY